MDNQKPTPAIESKERLEVAVVETNLTDEVRITIAKKLGEELILLVEESLDRSVDNTNSVL